MLRRDAEKAVRVWDWSLISGLYPCGIQILEGFPCFLSVVIWLSGCSKKKHWEHPKVSG